MGAISILLERIKEERTFRKGKLRIQARIIKMALPNRWLTLVMSPEVVMLEPNWQLIPEIIGEINENSLHPLAFFLRRPEISAFSIYPDSILIEPKVGQSSLRVAKKVAKLLFRWENDEFIRAAWWIILISELQMQDFYQKGDNCQ